MCDKMVCGKDACERWEAEDAEAEEAGGTDLKIKTLHNVVGKKRKTSNKLSPITNPNSYLI